MLQKFSRAAAYLLAPVLAIVPTLTALADVGLPAKEIADQLRPRTEAPVYLPEIVTTSSNSAIYWAANVNQGGYSVALEYRPECKGATYCYFGAISAQKGKLFSPREYAKEYEPVSLAKGMSGLYVSYCGVTCNNSIEWKLHGTLYRVNMKNGSFENLLKTANSMIEGGIR